MVERLRVMLKTNGADDDSELDSHWEDSWVHDWRTPFIPEIGPDRGATSEIPKPASDPPQGSQPFAG